MIFIHGFNRKKNRLLLNAGTIFYWDGIGFCVLQQSFFSVRSHVFVMAFYRVRAMNGFIFCMIFRANLRAVRVSSF